MKLTARQTRRVAGIAARARSTHSLLAQCRGLDAGLRTKLCQGGWIDVLSRVVFGRRTPPCIVRLTLRGVKGFRRIAGELGDSVKWLSGKIAGPRTYSATVGKHFYRIERARDGWYCYVTVNARWELVRVTRTLWQAKVFPFLYEAGEVGPVEETRI